MKDLYLGGGCFYLPPFKHLQPTSVISLKRTQLFLTYTTHQSLMLGSGGQLQLELLTALQSTSHLSAVRKPKIITTSKSPQSYENTNCASQPSSQLASKVPNSFLDLLLREVTGELHLPGISLRHKPDSASLNQTDQLKSQHGQYWFSRTDCFSSPFEVRK